MDLVTIDVAANVARRAFLDYRNAVRARHSDEDAALMRGYRELARGRRIIDVRETIRAGGVDATGRPRLAMARADWLDVGMERVGDGSVRFAISDRRNAVRCELPARTLPVGGWATGTAIVPIVPPALRPKADLSNYWTLFEADWGAPPRDPALLKPLGGGLYVVLAVWDLTALERAVLATTRG